MYNLQPWERETIIRWEDENKGCEIYTCNKRLMDKLDKLCKTNPESYMLKCCDEVSKTYLSYKKLIGFKKPVIMSDEQKQKLSERGKLALKSMRQNQQGLVDFTEQN